MNEDPTIPIGGLTPAMAAARSDAPATGAAWGSFSLLARVGHGGFGEVYRAWDPNLQREVALKLLLPGAVGGEAEYEAMLREARALASVRHPNIVPVYGIDRHEGRVGFWTDFVRGKTLSALLREQGTFGAREAALIGLDVARALSAVHRSGLLHRDIKAENVMREEGGRILLMDFGLSALEQRQTNIAGTPNYMAPELFKGGMATVATDIYAMGVLLYFLVAGDFPVHLGGLTTQQAREAISARKPLMDLRPDLPEPLLRTVSAAMEMDPAKRFTSAGQLANALAESLGTHAPMEASAAPEQSPVRKATGRWIFGGLISAAVLLAASAVWFGMRPKAPGHVSDGASKASDAAASDASMSGTTDEDFVKAQDLLLHSYKESNLAQAVQGFEAIVKADPNNALAQAQLGAAYFAQQDYKNDPKLLDKATEASNLAIKINKKLATPYITLARISTLEGQTQLATQRAEKARQLEPHSAEVHGALGELYEAQGLGKQALDEYQQAITLDPADWRWPLSLGVAEFTQGDTAGSIAQLRRAAEIVPDNAMAFYDLSIAYRELGQLEQARKELQHSLDLEPTARKYAAMGSLFLFEGKFKESVEMEKKAIELDPSRYEAYADLGAAYQWGGGTHDQVSQAFQKAIALEEAARIKRPQDAALLATLADDYATVGDSERSFVVARQALALAADSPTVEYKTGDAYETLGKRKEAIPLIAKALTNGYNQYEFEHNPGLAGLRRDPEFASALKAFKGKKK